MSGQRRKVASDEGQVSGIRFRVKLHLQKLKGGWRRPDGGYILAIGNVADSGAMEASYFNPSPIHVANAEASREGAVTTLSRM